MNLIQDIKSVTLYGLTEPQVVAINNYVTGKMNGRQAAMSVYMHRQQFVNLVFAVLPQMYLNGKIIVPVYESEAL